MTRAGEGALEGVRRPNRGEGRENHLLKWRPDAARPSGAGGLIEVEPGEGLGLGWVEGGRLVEVVSGDRVHRSDGIGAELECALGRERGRGRVGAPCAAGRGSGG
jgi:hypothetical protein